MDFLSFTLMKLEGLTKKETEVFLKKLGARIKQLRVNAGYTNYETFSYEAGISRGQYGIYEQGKNITVVSLLKIIKFHKITFEEFFAEGF